LKRLTIPFLVLLGVLAASGTALADHGDVAKPTCADIRFVDFGYATNGVVTGNVTTTESTCKSVTYSIYVIVDPGDPNSAVYTASARGDGTALTQLATTAITDDDNLVCAYATSSRGGQDGTNTVFDYTPNQPGCIELALGGSGSTGFD
jgi:hypothetical protein